MTILPEDAKELIGPGRIVLVVGPSGAGKDTLIAGVKNIFKNDTSITFPRRIITRPSSSSEDNDTIDAAAFDKAEQQGAFSFWWEAHGLKYGIPSLIDDDICSGRTIVCNASRAIIPNVRARYAKVIVVLVTAPLEILAKRLANRARSTDGNLADRVNRNNALGNFQADEIIENIGLPERGIIALRNIIGRRDIV